MVKRNVNLAWAILVFCLLGNFHFLTAQTLIINEVSNGPSGNKEYVEFLVIDTAVSYNCNSTTPPCIDIRGWIFDDNSGYHGSNGVAAGAMRFSNSPLWSCVPLGTIILLYNDADINPAVPAQDITLNDGNCRLVVPVSSSLIESNTTTPGALACSYPGSGWTAGGNWNTTALANPGDCARIVNLAGCEVFSLCYGSANTNTVIYFAGAGGQTVWYFNSGNPLSIANWTTGSAATTPGNQTPGNANNAANQSYIDQFNNGCQPITPLSATLGSTTNASCLCDGSASVTASGSLGGYTYIWKNASGTPLGQTSATATNLCAGNYTCEITSGIGCLEIVPVTISGMSSTNLTVNDTAICPGGNATLTAQPAIPGGTFLWSPGGATTSSISISPNATVTYSCTYTINGCSATGDGTVTIHPLPIVNAGNDQTICLGNSATISATGALTYVWDNGLGSGNNFTVNPQSTKTYAVTGTDVNGCEGTDNVIITVLNAAPIDAGTDQTVCLGASVTLQSSGNFSTISWNNGVTNGVPFTPNVSGTQVFTVTGTDANGCSIQDQVSVQIIALPAVSAGADQTVCTGTSLTLTGTGTATTYSWNNGVQNGVSFIPATSGSYIVSGNDTNGCTNQDTIQITVVQAPTLDFQADVLTGCTPLSVQFSNSLTGLNNILWNFGDGTSSSSPNHVYTQAGCFDVTLTANFNGCTLSTTLPNYICTEHSPQAAFHSSVQTLSAENSVVQFTNTSTNASSYFWNFGDSTVSIFENPIHAYSFQEGRTYGIYLVVSNAAGCTDTAFLQLTTEDQLIYYVPNAFTPDGDEFNNTFYPVFTAGFDPYDFHLTIFNRWGELLFESADSNVAWDGTYHNELCQAGIYTWRIEFKALHSDKRTIIHGHVNLVR